MNLARLLQLASPTLPVGAYSYSQGMEAAVEAGMVKDAESAERWIGDVLEFSVGRMEAAIVFHLMENPGSAAGLNALFLASRETAELRAESVQMGHSLSKLLEDLGAGKVPLDEPAFPTAYAFAALQWKIEPRAAVLGYLWSWLENQVMAALKALPLGQTAGQRILLSLAERLERMVERAASLPENEWCNFAPGLAVLSARHETQYSRLFRS